MTKKPIEHELDGMLGKRITPDEGMAVMTKIITETLENNNALVILAAGGPEGGAGMLTMSGKSDDIVRVFRHLLKADERAMVLLSKAIMDHIDDETPQKMLEGIKHMVAEAANCKDCPSKDECSEENRDRIAASCGYGKMGQA